MSYNFETDRVTKKILEAGAKRVLLQFPDGLKMHGPHLAAEIETLTKASVYVSADHNYGACDLPLDDAKHLNIDLIVHYGHAKFVPFETPNVMYVNAASTLSLEEVVRKAIPLLKEFRKLGLLMTVQHIEGTEAVIHLLRSIGKEVLTGKPGGHIQLQGQVLGCDYTAAKSIKDQVDAFLYVGGGDFHPLGAVIATEKPVIVADPYLGEAKDITSIGLKHINRRKGAIARLLEAQKIGVIVGLKHGQSNYSLGEELKRKFIDKGKSVTLLSLREVTPEALQNFPNIEAFINISCPRIGLDDSELFPKPILNPQEAMVAFGSAGDRFRSL